MCVTYCAKFRSLAEQPACDPAGTSCAAQIEQAGTLLQEFQKKLTSSGVSSSDQPLLITASDKAAAVYAKNRKADCALATRTADQQARCVQQVAEVLNAVALVGPALQTADN